MFKGVYGGRKILVTGHTGFKGSWLSLWLSALGADVVGLSLPPTTDPNHWNLLKLNVESYFADIRDEVSIRNKIHAINPDMIFHLAAQPLVRRSYQEPLETWSTNVMGTANILNAARDLDSLKAVVVVTTDKCYENKEWAWGYREIDPLGGHDPYSASKGGSELVAASFRNSFFNLPTSALIASARAGNVIGGGDWSEDRLIPDLIRSIESNNALYIRSPNATRPWQHVLECLSGYLALGQQLLQGNESCAEAWNFGPERDGNRQVKEVLQTIKKHIPGFQWSQSEGLQPHEAQLLHLDSGKARENLSWKPVWSFEEGIEATVNWYKAWLDRKELISKAQLKAYCELARTRGLQWVSGASI
ncbi:CDP-glucose 4,6-dehydratase [Polynucleobacter sp. JS-Fieb-80-E5]|uniref:CDP-glucose 4,6-dehydratase n=1 Tax=Polynucleobacter sp. JS-Fieb-80-E5 TaxID=2081050 RepID=UPI001C0DE589|nr:CDP-glucose 4,6-dehydratase [Polynucleobacter sp. JS-Fieb-80-E5]MBU3619959.1 CDP-glucose 4,6-dehydratase [Polynucleobacter sp. JS-Fieb-80-E5]